MSTETISSPPDDIDRLEWLIDAYLDGGLGGDALDELSQELLSSPAARAVFWKMARHHLLVERWGKESWGAAAARDSERQPAARSPRRRGEPGVDRRTSGDRWRRQGPYAAIVAFGAACTVLGAGVAFALVPIELPPLRERIHVDNAGFEQPLASPLSPTLSGRPPRMTGQWLGDLVRAVPSNGTVVPYEGARMLAFEQGLAGPSPRSIASACDLFQVVDLRSIMATHEAGKTTLSLAARFHQMPELGSVASEPESGDQPSSRRTRVTCRVFVFQGAIGDVVDGWPLTINSAIALGFGVAELPLAGSAGSSEWVAVNAQTLLPPAATFAILQISAGSPANGPRRDGLPIAFCDDVRAEIMSHETAWASRGAYYWALMTGQDRWPGIPHGQ